MNEMTSWWKQGELGYFTLGETCLGISLLRILCECKTGASLLSARGHCPSSTLLNVSAHRVLGRPLSHFAYSKSHIFVACAHLRRYILATWPTHFNFRPWAAATLYLVFVLCLFQHSPLGRSTQHAVFSVPSHCDYFETSFSLAVSDYFWALHNRTGDTQDSGPSLNVSSFLESLGQCKSLCFWTFQSHSSYLFDFVSRVVSERYHWSNFMYSH